MKPFFSVVVCSYNREAYIGDAIESLAKQTLAPSYFEVLVVDNNSKDGTAQEAKKHIERYANSHNMRYIFEQEQGLCYARNRGIEESQGEFVVYMDDDGIADTNFLQVQYDFLIEHPDAKGLGGKIIPKYVHGKPAWIDGILEGLVSKVDHGEAVFQYPMKKYPVGCNMTYSKDLLLEIGMFDTSVGQVGDNLVRGDETELYQRVRKITDQIYYLPQSQVQHVIEQDRLTKAHIRKMSLGVGRGRRILYDRANFSGKIKLIFEQIVKAVGALVFALGYLLIGKPQKSMAWLNFRKYVISGFLFR